MFISSYRAIHQCLLVGNKIHEMPRRVATKPSTIHPTHLQTCKPAYHSSNTTTQSNRPCALWSLSDIFINKKKTEEEMFVADIRDLLLCKQHPKQTTSPTSQLDNNFNFATHLAPHLAPLGLLACLLLSAHPHVAPLPTSLSRISSHDTLVSYPPLSHLIVHWLPMQQQQLTATEMSYAYNHRSRIQQVC